MADHGQRIIISKIEYLPGIRIKAYNNMTNSIKKSERKFILNKIAKKRQSDLYGKHSRKEVEKMRDKSVKKFNDYRTTLEKMRAERDRLDRGIGDLEVAFAVTQEDVTLCHEILRNMDFTGAGEVKVHDLNKDDIAYLCDNNRWMAVDSDHKTLPFSARKKQDEQSADDSFEDETDYDGEDIPLE